MHDGGEDDLRAAVRAAGDYVPDPGRAPVPLALPFQGTWIVQNSPATRVPSHGTHVLGETYAIDFVAVDRRGRTAPVRDWRTVAGTEPPERFFAFDRPILAPASGRVVAVHDGEPDHPARRSPLTLVPYMLTQAGRLRQGLGAVAGNYVILSLGASGPYAGLVHLRRGSLLVRPGDEVTAGRPLARCGNSGNSTQPHVHVQVMDSSELLRARGLPMAFSHYRLFRRRDGQSEDVALGMPRDGDIVEPLRAE
ncbi:M23 family metallopeptidase [Georgenia daeguensis]|uniref:M23 family metallopeptidase n=1 Tax=Georgenia daeguensis TaxID=908355 RepID=A0ABP8EPK9_9MICO